MSVFGQEEIISLRGEIFRFLKEKVGLLLNTLANSINLGYHAHYNG